MIVILPSASEVVDILVPPSILICSPLSTSLAVESSAPIRKLYSSPVWLAGISARVIKPASFVSSLVVLGIVGAPVRLE